jgi:hypothetical protein
VPEPSAIVLLSAAAMVILLGYAPRRKK